MAPDAVDAGERAATSATAAFERFETIDWMDDSLQERRRRQRDAGQYGGKLGITSYLSAIGRASQSWFVISLVGAAIGVNAALISVMTEWLSDLKLGRCSNGWWLNRKFCCWEIDVAEGMMCDDWLPWSRWSGPAYLIYVVLAVGFVSAGAFLVRTFAPFAAGSGISEIKCMLAGFMLDGYLSVSTLAIKSLTLPLAIASGLSVGKEGPSVHVACAIGNVVARGFKRFNRSQARMREIVTAASAAGVAVAFGSPIGGVLFSLEEMTVTYPIRTMWRSFFCALAATVTLSAMNPFRTGKLVLFQVSYNRDWHFFEFIFFIILGIFGGLYGAFVTKYNLQVASFRRRHLASHGVAEAITLGTITALISYFNGFLRMDMTESLDLLFSECEPGTPEGEGPLCQSWAQWQMVNSLLLATVIRTGLVIISYGCKVPAGIFVPSMAVGATFGRMVGLLVKAAHVAYPGAAFFSACEPDRPCITPGTYALLGAAAALSGIMRITVTVVVIMFELTGALTYILPTMIVVMVTKAVSDSLSPGKGGIADQSIKFNGYPCLDKEDHTFNRTIGQVMRRQVTPLPASGMRIDELEARISANAYRGFPVTRSRDDRTLLGYITHDSLARALDHARDIDLAAPDAAVLLVRERHSDVEAGAEDESVYAGVVDLSDLVNKTPLAVSPRQPLEVVIQLFKSMGPRVVLVEQHGALVGLLTLKDILRVVAKAEAAHQATNAPADLEESLDDLREWLAVTWDRLRGR